MLFRRQGENLDYVCTEDVVRGDIIVINDVIGIAATSASTGDLIAVYMEGVFALPKGEEELKQGKKVYYDKTTKKLQQPHLRRQRHYPKQKNLQC